MINQEYLDVLKILHSKLSNSNMSWYITGKANLTLQGINIKPSHLGVLIYNNDLDKFLELFSDYKKSKIELLPNKEAEEFIMKINNIDVLVCAEYPHGTYWEVMQEPVFINLETKKIPCFSLTSEKQFYTKFNIVDKVKIIEEFLKLN